MVKFLELPVLDAINSALVFETPECKVFGRVEPYSCKAAGADKKLYKQIGIKYDNSNSPPEDSIRNIISPFGPLDQPASRRTLFYLIGTLNASYPDYDFSDAKPEQFRKEPSVPIVVNSINATLFNHGKERIIKELRIWEAVDSLIDFEDSDVYSYNPDMDSDPNDEEGSGTLWSTNFFFFNRKLKRIVFFTMRGVSYGADLQEGEEDEMSSGGSDDEEGANSRRQRRPSMRYEDFVVNDMEMQ